MDEGTPSALMQTDAGRANFAMYEPTAANELPRSLPLNIRVRAPALHGHCVAGTHLKAAKPQLIGIESGTQLGRRRCQTWTQC